MMGVNVPTHPIFVYGLLPGLGVWGLEYLFHIKLRPDILNMEVEYFPSYFPDSYWKPVINGYALPVVPQGEQYDSTVYQPRWNWSLYMKKQVTGHFGMVLKVGRDHQRWEFHPAQYNYYDFEAAMVKPDEWGWQGATVFSF